MYGNPQEQMIGKLTEMGFPRDQVIKALNAAFNDPDRAVEYLFNPEAMPPPEEPPMAPQAGGSKQNMMGPGSLG